MFVLRRQILTRHSTDLSPSVRRSSSKLLNYKCDSQSGEVVSPAAPGSAPYPRDLVLVQPIPRLFKESEAFLYQARFESGVRLRKPVNGSAYHRHPSAP